jgi:hypothetical protein
MRRTSFWLLVVLFFLAPLAHAWDENATPLAVDNDVPGGFHPFIVSHPPTPTGEQVYKGKFHCLVTEFGLDPVVLVFVRGVEANDAVKYLMVKLDNAIDKNRGVRLKGAAIFVPDDLEDAVKDDDKRETYVLKLQDLEKATAVKQLTIALDSKKDLKRYKLPDDAGVFVLVYNRYRILMAQPFEADKFTEEAAKKILGEIAEKFKLRS